MFHLIDPRRLIFFLLIEHTIHLHTFICMNNFDGFVASASVEGFDSISYLYIEVVVCCCCCYCFAQPSKLLLLLFFQFLEQIVYKVVTAFQLFR